jgi:3-oxoacyl-[acyl-carrier-protein] synthase-3
MTGPARAGIGIGAISCVLPEVTIPIGELPEVPTLDREQADFVATSGIRTVGVVEEPAADLAVRAVRQLLASPGSDPDVLILVAPRAPEMLLGSDAGRVQADAKLPDAVAFTLDGLGCTGSSAAWGLGRDLLLADAARECVLIAHASRPAALDRVRYPVTVVGDGGCAMTLVRGGRPVLRAHRMATDGAFHDLFGIDYRSVPQYEWQEVCASPDRYRFELALHSRNRLAELTERVLADAGVERGDIAAVLMQNVAGSAYQFYETLLGLPIHPVCAAALAEYGHLGAMDVVLNLHNLLATGDHGPGDLVLVLNNSPVAAWAVTLWEL